MEKSATRKPNATKKNPNVLSLSFRCKDCVVTKKNIPYAAHSNAVRQVTNQYTVWPLINCRPTSAANSTIGTNKGLRRSSSVPETSLPTAQMSTQTAAPTSSVQMAHSWTAPKASGPNPNNRHKQATKVQSRIRTKEFFWLNAEYSAAA